MTSPNSQPIGVFDSGVGGLSVLRALRAELPHERFVYLADSAHAPYGERGDAYVGARTHAITRHLLEQHGIKALVVACNTATAAAIHEVRSRYPALPLVGLEPAIKPALAVTQTGRLLEGAGLLAAPQEQPAAPDLQLYTTGGLPQLQSAARRWLDVPADGCHTVAITSETTETT
jgi:glutamate racemase